MSNEPTYIDHFKALKILKCSELALDELIHTKRLRPAYSSYAYGGIVYHFWPEDVERIKAELNPQLALL